MGSASIVEEFSTVTEPGQTAVPKQSAAPKNVRQALRLDGDRLALRVGPPGVAFRAGDRRAGDRRDAPAVGAFMAFFAEHVQRHPEQLKALTPEFARNIVALSARDADGEQRSLK